MYIWVIIEYTYLKIKLCNFSIFNVFSNFASYFFFFNIILFFSFLIFSLMLRECGRPFCESQQFLFNKFIPWYVCYIYVYALCTLHSIYKIYIFFFHLRFTYSQLMYTYIYNICCLYFLNCVFCILHWKFTSGCC